MKKILFILIIALCGGCFYSCTQKTDKQGNEAAVMKQIRVAAKSATLRMGPGDEYEVALNEDDTQCTMARGTVLDVVASKDGWYEVRIDDEFTAFIKQSLCEEVTVEKSKGKSAKRKKSEDDDPGIPATSSKRLSPDLSPSASANEAEGTAKEVSEAPASEE